MAHWTARSIAHRLGGKKARRSGKNWLTICPAHKDVGPSLSMRDKDEETVLFNCLAGCDFVSIVTALRCDYGIDIPSKGRPATGRKSSTSKKAAPVKTEAEEDEEVWIYRPDLAESTKFVPEMLGKRAKRLTLIWDWRDKGGRLLFHTARFDELDGTKNIVPITPCVEERTGEFQWRQLGPKGPRPLYNLESLGDQKIVLIVEGEKPAEAAKRLFKDQANVWVTTTLGGCRSPHLVDWTPVQGRKVVISHDFDQPGLVYASTVSENCYLAGATECVLWTLDPDTIITAGRPTARTDDPPSGYDLFDAEQDGWTLPLLATQNTPWHGPKIIASKDAIAVLQK